MREQQKITVLHFFPKQLHEEQMNRQSSLVYIFTALIFLSSTLSLAEEHQVQIPLVTPVSIDCQYRRIDDVLLDISRQSGLTINHEQMLEVEAFFPFNDNLKAIDAVVRLLRGYNTVIEFNSDQNNINIQIFDEFDSIN